MSKHAVIAPLIHPSHGEDYSRSHQSVADRRR